MRALLIAAIACAVPAPVHADVRELVGARAPGIRARALDTDAELDPADRPGRVVVLVFVATWCSSCRRLTPDLEALLEEHRAAGLEVVALSHEPRSRLRAHVAARAPTLRWLQCTGHSAVVYHADALPTAVVIGRDGTVRAAFQGARPDTAARVRRAVLRALAR